MPPPPNPGFYEEKKRSVANIELPPIVKCLDCKRNLVLAKFSIKQQNEYRGRIHRSGQFGAKLPSCMTCTGGGQKMEFQCGYCDKVKGRDEFMKAQLKNNADSPTCKDCAQSKMDMVPNPKDALEEIKIEDEVASGVSSMSLSSSTGGSRRGFSTGSFHGSFGNDASEDGDGAWVTQNGSSNGHEFIPTSTSQNNRSQVRSSSDCSDVTFTAMASVANSAWGVFPQAPRPSRTVPRASNAGSNTGFAKQGAEWREEDRRRNMRSKAEDRIRDRKDEELKKVHLPTDSDDDDGDDDDDGEAPY